MTDITSSKYNAANTLSLCNAGYLNSTISQIDSSGGVLMPVGESPVDQWGVGADIQNGLCMPPANYTGRWVFDGFPRGQFWNMLNETGYHSYIWEVTHQQPLHDSPNDRCAVITYDTITPDMLYIGSTTAPDPEKPEEALQQVVGARTYNCTPFISHPIKSWTAATYTYGSSNNVCCLGGAVNSGIPTGSVTCAAGIYFDNGSVFTLPEIFKNLPDGTIIQKCYAHFAFPSFKVTSSTLRRQEDGFITIDQVVLAEVENAAVAVYSMRMRDDGTPIYKCLGTIEGQKVKADCLVDITAMAQVMFEERSESLGYMVFPCAGAITPDLEITDFRGLLESFMVPVTATFDNGTLTGITSGPAIWYEWGLGGCVTEMYVMPSYPEGVISEANPTWFVTCSSRDQHIGQPVFPPMN